MSSFRDQFQAGRGEYQAIQYPGNLSRELLLPKMRWKNVLVFGSLGVGSIAAAAVVAAFMIQPLLRRPSPGPGSRLPLVENVDLTKDLKFALPPLPGIPENLSFRSVEPQGQSPSEIHIPLWDDLHLPNLTPSSEHV